MSADSHAPTERRRFELRFDKLGGWIVTRHWGSIARPGATVSVVEEAGDPDRGERLALIAAAAASDSALLGDGEAYEDELAELFRRGVLATVEKEPGLFVAFLTADVGREFVRAALATPARPEGRQVEHWFSTKNGRRYSGMSEPPSGQIAAGEWEGPVVFEEVAPAPGVSPSPPARASEAHCNRCRADKGAHAIGELCDQNCGGRIVPGATPSPPPSGCTCGPMNFSPGLCPVHDQASGPVSSEDVARLFHETYERLAPEFGYKDPRSIGRAVG